MKHILPIIIVAIFGTAFAGSSTTILTITATVQPTCQISVTPLAFGQYDPWAVASNKSTATITISCIKGMQGITVGLDYGQHAQNQARFLDSNKTFQYNIFKPSQQNPGASCAYTTMWGNSGNSLFSIQAPTSKAPRIYNICGEIPAGQDIGVGDYTDSVTVTINW